MRDIVRVLFEILWLISLISFVVFAFLYPESLAWVFTLGVFIFSGIVIFFTLPSDYEDYDYAEYDHEETTNEEKKSFIVKLKTTCPHCGAPMINDICSYCGCKSEIYKVIQ